MSGRSQQRSSSGGRCPPQQRGRQEQQQRCGAAGQEPRYDPKELRDAAKVLGPFVRLIEDANNPYARIVSREVCKTFYHLFHPGMHPADVMGAVNWDVKAQRTQQLWTEFWQYVPNARVKCWKSLKETENLIQFTGGDNNRGCALPPPMLTPSPQKPSGAECGRQQKQNRPDCDDGDDDNDCDGDDNRQCPKAPHRPVKSRPQNRKSMAAMAAMCNLDDSRNLADETMPDLSLESSDSADECDEHQSAGSDLPLKCPAPIDVCDNDCHSSAVAAAAAATSSSSSSCTSTALNRIRHRMTESKRELERLVDAACNKCCSSAYLDGTLRQTAGNDEDPSQSCRPECGGQQTSGPVATIRADEYDYYRMSANMTPISPLRDMSAVDLFPQSGDRDNDGCRNGGGAAAAAAACSQCDDVGGREAYDGCDSGRDGGSGGGSGGCSGGGGSAQDECDDDDDVDDEEDAAAAASLMANAFTNLSLAEQDLQKKKKAYAMLTKKYLEFAQNPMEMEPPCPSSPTAKQILQAIFDNPPHVLKPFDDCEWNDNAFKDRDFVRLLPLYELVLNQLEYVSKKQREYGFDMLDDVMSTLYHIHYDLGDPRLKNDMLIEHVKLITRNTWEAFFYDTAAGEKMPNIPEVPSRNPVRRQSREPPSHTQPPVCPSPRRQESQTPPPSVGTTPRRRQATPEPGVNCPPQHQSPELECTPPSGRRNASTGRRNASTGRRQSASPAAMMPPSMPPPSVPATLPPPPPPPRTCPIPPATVRPAPNTPRHTRPTGHGRTGPGRNPPPPPPPPAQASTSAAGASSSVQDPQAAQTPAGTQKRRLQWSDDVARASFLRARFSSVRFPCFVPVGFYLFARG